VSWLNFQVSAVLNRGVASLVKKQISMVKSTAKRLKAQVASTSLTALQEYRSVHRISTDNMKLRAAANDVAMKTTPLESIHNQVVKDNDDLGEGSGTSYPLSLLPPLKRALLAVAGRQRRAIVAELQNIANSAESTLLLGQAATEIQCHKFLNDLANERFENKM
jgi:hypothetical protein